MKNKTRILAVLTAFLMLSSTAFATDGYFGLGYDTKSKGMAGAGVALYQASYDLLESNATLLKMTGKIIQD